MTVGYEGSGKGGFEYRIIRDTKKKDEQSFKGYYLHISVSHVESCTLSPHVLPLVIGPIQINNNSESVIDHPTNAPIELWPENTCMVHDIYRLFSHTVVQEYWDAGIPGKIWDSAIVMLEFLKNLMPFLAERQHIVDLSAGTGLLGYYANNNIHSGATSSTDHHVTITELEEALELIQRNATLNSNQPKVNIHPLLWGNREQAEMCGKADIIMASDVLYESGFFDDLVQALYDLSKPTTKIYIGYKRRGLDTAEEERFWKRCMDRGFKVTLLQQSSDIDNNDAETDMVPDLAQQTGVQIYRLTRCL
ncbi:putative methyltransferase-domain-containing protein [Phascolomyces articulosus]|uniref:Methyltransferase-domain-containing protein n=1 Tax=Phascolomyces articulosus TaxID=60185 RepID=A0AAD5JV21_9FUNG|nr:putative methyltransferase-domain-containing protein [Phascolomyces articulosus]